MQKHSLPYAGARGTRFAYSGRNFRLATGLRVATKYPRLAQSFFQQQGLPIEVIALSGSIELAPLVGLADLLVDLVETGRTLQENGLVELEQITPCQATVVVNRVAHRLRLAEIRGLLSGLEEANQRLFGVD